MFLQETLGMRGHVNFLDDAKSFFVRKKLNTSIQASTTEQKLHGKTQFSQHVFFCSKRLVN